MDAAGTEFIVGEIVGRWDDMEEIEDLTKESIEA